MRVPRHTTDFKVVPFEAGHATDLIERNTSKATADYGYMLKAYIDAMELPGHGYTLMKNGHLIAAAGCPTIVLFSDDSDPVLTAPRGPLVEVIKRNNLEKLETEAVAAALRLR